MPFSFFELALGLWSAPLLGWVWKIKMSEWFLSHYVASSYLKMNSCASFVLVLNSFWLQQAPQPHPALAFVALFNVKPDVVLVLLAVHQDSSSNTRVIFCSPHLLLLLIQWQQRPTTGQLRMHPSVCFQVCVRFKRYSPLNILSVFYESLFLHKCI